MCGVTIGAFGVVRGRDSCVSVGACADTPHVWKTIMRRLDEEIACTDRRHDMSVVRTGNDNERRPNQSGRRGE